MSVTRLSPSLFPARSHRPMVASLAAHREARAAKLEDPGRGDPGRFLNRDLSWISLSHRVLDEAANPRHPLLSRLRFLSISATNLDEFLMFRLSELYRQAERRPGVLTQDGLTPAENLAKVSTAIGTLLTAQQDCWRRLKRELGDNGIDVVRPEELTEADREWLDTYVQDQVNPLLTPFAIDPGHPFPFVPTMGIVIALRLRRRDDGREITSLLPLPQQTDRFVRLPGQAARFVALEDIITVFLGEIFAGYDVLERGLFRILRESNVRTEGGASDLVQFYESALKRRRRGPITRVIVDRHLSSDLRQLVLQELGVGFDRIVDLDGLLGLSDVVQLIVDNRPELRFPPYRARFPERIHDFGGDCFAAIRFKDMIVHHPYESFDVVEQFIRQAASDPAVVAIKQTIYRTSEKSPIIEALIAAAEVGKSVTVLVELKAEFDEATNIRWARNLERAGVQVVYGVLDLITHAKISLVVRREGKDLRTYVHFGTGNYHPVNAQGYTDLSLFTADPDFGHDALAVFNMITGYIVPDRLRRIAVAPHTLRSTLMALIEDEIGHALAGRPAAIWLKLNALGDPGMIDALYRASQSGVQIDIVVRGICCLRPGVPGLSDNIRVKSLVDRFLEHSRIVCFGAGHGLPSREAKVFLSSSDWMTVNFEGRIEPLVPVLNPTVHRQVLDEVMVANLKDEAQSWALDAEGHYHRVTDNPDGFRAQLYFMTNPSLSGRGSALSAPLAAPDSHEARA
jgi:polyphosphate kinase